MTLLIIILIVAALVFSFIIFTYNRLVKLQNLVKESWSGIEVQLKQRSSLVPNLLETVKGYMGHERGILERITELRTQALNSGSVHERAENENMLTGALKQLFAVSENYPDLKASTNFIELQKSLENIENQIQLARRYYNGTVRDFNIVVESFPSNIIAKYFSYQKAEFFEIEDAKEREVPKVQFP